jgi:hypothetical protein
VFGSELKKFQVVIRFLQFFKHAKYENFFGERIIPFPFCVESDQTNNLLLRSLKQVLMNLSRMVLDDEMMKSDELRTAYKVMHSVRVGLASQES